MHIGFESRGQATGVVQLSGRLDIGAAAETTGELQRLVSDGWLQLVADLANVSFMDSSGLGAVIAVLKAARQAGGDFRIARPGDQVRHILTVSTLDTVLYPFATVEDALAGYR